MSFRDMEEGRTRNPDRVSGRQGNLNDDDFDELTKLLSETDSLIKSISSSLSYGNQISSAKRIRDSQNRQSVNDLIQQASANSKRARALLSRCSSRHGRRYELVKLAKDFERQSKALEETINAAIVRETQARQVLEDSNKVSAGDAQVQNELEQQLLSNSMEYSYEDMLQREAEIEKLHATAKEVGTLFTDISGMVNQQKEQVDEIDRSINYAHDQTGRGLAQLDKATKYLKLVNKRALYFFLFLLLVVVITISVLFFRH